MFNKHVKDITMSSKEFSRLSEYIQKECGIKMSDSKKTMLEARLLKRLRALRMHSFTEYCDFLFSEEGADQEVVHMIDVVTTNKTDFFREPVHFEYLVSRVVPELIHRQSSRLVLWSAGCSTGEEPYTISMVLKEFQAIRPDFQFTVLATDISTKVLESAQRAVYKFDQIAPMPEILRKKYLLKSRDKSSQLVRIVPELRQMVRFRRLNFLEDDFGFREKLAVIFCRNVMIYFDRETQHRVLTKFCRHLAKGGYLFVGHSETLSGLDLPLEQAAPTIYRKIS
ncbi:MAG: CheR family methyltransferase [Dissulfurispiraceae bacterium]|jgi:chemotaxis protein methyltransferase CheR|nr:CheR family methyltransferase [Dissulfurispiraceae bacterium]